MIGGLPEIPIYQKLSGMRSAQGNHSIKRGKKINSTEHDLILKLMDILFLMFAVVISSAEGREALKTFV
jgi:hypothetical protein